MIRQMLNDSNFMLSLIFGAILLLFITEAEAKVIVCETNSGEQIVMGVADLVKTARHIASEGDITTTYHIEDVNNFNEVDDYLVREQVKDGKTYRITYSLDCKDAK